MADNTSDTAIIFTAALRERAEKTPRYTGPLLHSWARLPEDEGGALRAQLERAAAWVPPKMRTKVLGQLLAKSAPDKHVRSTVGTLLLAKTLSDLGFDVDFDPPTAHQTPDLLVVRSGKSFLIEVRRVADSSRDRVDGPVARVRDALIKARTHYPISLRSIHLQGGGSLKTFVSHLKELWSSNPTPGRRTFQAGETRINYDVHERFTALMPAIFGWSSGIHWGRPHGAVREHIDAKLRKYKFPIIVALEFDQLHGAFETTEEVLVGQRVFHVPVRFDGLPSEHEPATARAADGLVHMRDALGDRARERLEAVLPFCLRYNDEGRYAVFARLLANPAKTEQARFDEFAPMPRLIVTEDRERERIMSYVGEIGVEANGPMWRHVP